MQPAAARAQAAPPGGLVSKHIARLLTLCRRRRLMRRLQALAAAQPQATAALEKKPHRVPYLVVHPGKSSKGRGCSASSLQNGQAFGHHDAACVCARERERERVRRGPAAVAVRLWPALDSVPLAEPCTPPPAHQAATRWSLSRNWTSWARTETGATAAVGPGFKQAAARAEPPPHALLRACDRGPATPPGLARSARPPAATAGR